MNKEIKSQKNVVFRVQIVIFSRIWLKNVKSILQTEYVFLDSWNLRIRNLQCPFVEQHASAHSYPVVWVCSFHESNIYKPHQNIDALVLVKITSDVADKPDSYIFRMFRMCWIRIVSKITGGDLPFRKYKTF